MKVISELLRNDEIETDSDGKGYFVFEVEEKTVIPKEIPRELELEISYFFHPLLSRTVALGLLPHFSKDPSIRALHSGVFCSFLSKGLYDPRLLIVIAEFAQVPTTFLNAKK